MSAQSPAERLRCVLLEMDSQQLAEVAELSGVPVTLLLAWKRPASGKVMPNRDQLERIAMAAGFPVPPDHRPGCHCRRCT